MNSMVAVGCTSALLQSAAAIAFPHTGWGAASFDEVAMLLGFILLGRSLEHRARVNAASSLRVRPLHVSDEETVARRRPC